MTDWEIPSQRWKVQLAVTGIVALVTLLVTAIVIVRDGETGQLEVETVPSPAPLPLGTLANAPVGSWRSLPPSPAQVARARHAAFWIQNRLLVWGGEQDGRALANGGLVDVSNGIWEEVPAGPQPWSPETGVVLAGRTLVTLDPQGGAAFDLSTRTWRGLPPAPPGNWTWTAATWDGAGVVVPGLALGMTPDSPQPAGRAMRLDLSGPGWERLPDPPITVTRGQGAGTGIQDGALFAGMLGSANPALAHWDPGGRQWALVWGPTREGRWLPALTSGGDDVFAFGPLVAPSPSYVALRWTIESGIETLPPLAEPLQEARPALGVSGRKIVVWAGGEPKNGAVFDLDADGWKPMAQGLRMSGREGASMTWSGHEFIFWGGRQEGRWFADGAAYLPPDPPDPPVERFEDATERAGVWRFAPPPPVQRTDPVGHWIDGEVAIWGGSGGERALLFDPVRESWRALRRGPLAPRRRALTAWTGQELLVWGGVTSSGQLQDGAALNPESERWRLLPPPPAGPSIGVQLAAWADGRWYLLRGGHELDFSSYDPQDDVWRAEASPPADVGMAMALLPAGEGALLLHTNARDANTLRYDTAARAWEVRAPRPEMTADGAVVVWTGDELLVWGGAADHSRAHGHAYDPERDAWRLIPAAPVQSPRRQPIFAWTGEELYVWGSRVIDATYRVPGLVSYDPSKGEWSAPPQPTVGTGPHGPMVWTGDGLFMWFGDGPPRIFVPQ